MAPVRNPDRAGWVDLARAGIGIDIPGWSGCAGDPRDARRVGAGGALGGVLLFSVVWLLPAPPDP